MSQKRMKPEKRRELIVKAATQLVEKHGLDGVTRSQVARKAKVVEGLVSHYFSPLEKLWEAVITTALDAGNPAVLSLMLTHPTYKKRLNETHRKLAIEHLEAA